MAASIFRTRRWSRIRPARLNLFSEPATVPAMPWKTRATHRCRTHLRHRQSGSGARTRGEMLPSITHAFASERISDIEARLAEEDEARLPAEAIYGVVRLSWFWSQHNVRCRERHSAHGRDIRLAVMPAGQKRFRRAARHFKIDVGSLARLCRASDAQRVDAGKIEDIFFVNCAASVSTLPCSRGCKKVETSRELRFRVYSADRALRISGIESESSRPPRRETPRSICCSQLRMRRTSAEHSRSPSAIATDGKLDAVSILDVPAWKGGVLAARFAANTSDIGSASGEGRATPPFPSPRRDLRDRRRAPPCPNFDSYGIRPAALGVVAAPGSRPHNSDPMIRKVALALCGVTDKWRQLISPRLRDSPGSHHDSHPCCANDRCRKSNSCLRCSDCHNGRQDSQRTSGLDSGPGRRKVIDLGDLTLLSGFIDSHSHITRRTLGDPQGNMASVSDSLGTPDPWRSERAEDVD